MSESTAPTGARWIVLVPSPADEAWRAAITAGAAEAGLRVVDAHPDHPAEVMEDPATLVLTPLPATIRDEGRTAAVVLIPDPAGAVDVIGRRFELALHQSLWVGSQTLADACVLASETRVMTPADLPPGAAVEILPGLVVTVPSRLARAAKDETPERAAVALYAGGPPPVGARANWAPSIFIYDDKGAIGSGVVDITGRPRILAHGPYVALTPGRWRVTARFLIDEEAAGRSFRFDWGPQNREFASHTVTLPRAGEYVIELDDAWDGSMAAEFRIFVMEGAFSGHLTFLGAEVVRIA